MKLIIEIPDEAYNKIIEEQHLPNRLNIEWCIVHGKPVEELDNPCIECGTNDCCHEECECRRFFIELKGE